MTRSRGVRPLSASPTAYISSVRSSAADCLRLMRGAHAFAFPSRGEPFGIALLEAMAAGVPAVATAAGGVPEFATDEINALLVPPDDIGALTSALERIACDVQLRLRLVAEGMRTAGELAWSRIAQLYEAVYLEAQGHDLSESANPSGARPPST